MATIDSDSKARLVKYVDHNEQESLDNEDIFLDLCRVLLVMLVVFALVYGVWFA
ncbi:hypothetical protein [Kangiella sp. TOML190]|uniref:hypothetical protein n=1 Tax=Kangiella sp. TOML190 TaxID=2931351 RepID=UPI002042298F|nr:hypothetical protein [Kangiella sp. TOML190]